MRDNNNFKELRRLWSILFFINVFIAALVLLLIVWTNAQIKDVDAQVISLEEREAILVDRAVTTDELINLYATIQSAEESALGFLGVFESISFGVSILSIVVVAVGLIAAVLGFSNFNELRKEVEATEKQFRQSAESFKNLEDTFQKRLAEEIQTTRQAWLLTSLAERTLAQGNLESALQSLERAFELDEYNPLPSYYLGYIALNSSKEKKAQQYFERAIKIDPKYYQALAALGFTLRRIGEKEEDEQARQSYFKQAEELLRNALGNDFFLMDFEGESWHGSLAGLYRRTNRLDDAIHHYRKAREVTPLSSYPTGNLARIAIQTNPERVDVNALYKDVQRLAQLEINADIGNYWAQADLLAAVLVLGEPEEQVMQDYYNLLDSIPGLVLDVLPRVKETIEDIKHASAYNNDKRNPVIIDKILALLEEEIDKKQSPSKPLTASAEQ